MTTTLSTCPDWCNLDRHSEEGEHWRFVDPMDHIPADRSRARSGHAKEFPSIPLIGANLRWYANSGGGVEVLLHEHEADTEWVFSPYGAFELLTHILDAYVAAMDELQEVPMNSHKTFDTFRALSDRIERRIELEHVAALRDAGARVRAL